MDTTSTTSNTTISGLSSTTTTGTIISSGTTVTNVAGVGGHWLSSSTSPVFIWGDDRDSFTMKSFLALEDRELQKFIFTCGNVQKINVERKHVNTEEKVGFYLFEESIRQNLQGAFYKNSRMKEWIVYDKATKKVKMSGNVSQIFPFLISKYVKYAAMFSQFWLKPTKTMCKYLITGKISSLRDLLSYHRSYTFRNKALSIDVIYDYFVANKVAYLHILKDPENVPREEIKLLEVAHELLFNRIFKVDYCDLGKSSELYGKWYKEQSEKFSKLKGPGNAEIRYTDVNHSSY